MPHLAHHPSPEAVLRVPTIEDPWRILVSGCLAGLPVGVDGTSYGMSLDGAPWLRDPRIRLIPFCPEDAGLGTPRPMPDLHGGDGFAVLRGGATVQAPDGSDLTEGMRRGADAMVEVAVLERVDFALLTDRSGACGSQVVSFGCRFEEPVHYVRGVGVATAALLERGVWVVSQRDQRTLDRIRSLLDPGFVPDEHALDHHQHPWTVNNLGRLPAHDDRARSQGIVVFRDRIVLDAQPPVTAEQLERIQAVCAGPIPAALRDLWSLTFGGALDYDLEAVLGDRSVEVSFTELFYPGSGHYRDLDGWVEHELELAEQAAEERGEVWSGKLDFLPFGGFEYLERMYVVVRPGPDHGAVVYLREGLPPTWNDPGGIATVADDVHDLFAKLTLFRDPRDVRPREIASGTDLLEAIRALAEPDLAADLEACLLSARAPFVEPMRHPDPPEEALAAFARRALDRDDVQSVLRLRALGVELADLEVAGTSVLVLAIREGRERVAAGLLEVLPVEGADLLQHVGRKTSAMVVGALLAAGVRETPEWVVRVAVGGNLPAACRLAVRLRDADAANVGRIGQAVEAALAEGLQPEALRDLAAWLAMG